MVGTLGAKSTLRSTSSFSDDRRITRVDSRRSLRLASVAESPSMRLKILNPFTISDVRDAPSSMPVRSSSISLMVNSRSNWTIRSCKAFTLSATSSSSAANAVSKPSTSVTSSKSRRKDCALEETKLMGLFSSCAMPAVS